MMSYKFFWNNLKKIFILINQNSLRVCQDSFDNLKIKLHHNKYLLKDKLLNTIYHNI